MAHRDIVEVAIDSEGRDLVFGDVVLRVKDGYALELHLDTDEGNATQVRRGLQSVLHRTESRVRLVRGEG